MDDNEQAEAERKRVEAAHRAKVKKLKEFHLAYRQAPPDRVEQLTKQWKDSSGHLKTAGPFDYVGHANATDILLAEDPDWDWRPPKKKTLKRLGVTGALQKNSQGWPTGLWIELRLHGKWRLGYGTCPPGKVDAVKELIGDAIRNAAMRFGLALDLWAKSDLAVLHAEQRDGGAGEPEATASADPGAATAPPAAPTAPAGPAQPPGPANGASGPQRPAAATPREELSKLITSLKGESISAFQQYRKDHQLPADLRQCSDDQVADLVTFLRGQPVGRVAG